MFEEFEAHSYYILDKKIKSYINTLYEMSSCAFEESDRAEEKGLDTVREYFNGYTRATNCIIRDLTAIINGVERDTKKAIDIEDKKFSKYIESEEVRRSSEHSDPDYENFFECAMSQIAADLARSKQL